MDAGPEIHPHHHHRPMRHWVDMVMGASAIGISLVSLFVALEDGNAMKRLVQANSWPFVSGEYSTLGADGTPHFRMMLTNKGVGPAKIETLEVFVDGKPVTGPRHLLAALIGSEGLNHAHQLGTSDIVGSVLSARESVDYFNTLPDTFTPEQNMAIRNAAGNRINSRVCYCSVFDECWTRGGPSGDARARPVKRCEMPKTPYQNGSLDLVAPS
jgi:hypothetical protein